MRHAALNSSTWLWLLLAIFLPSSLCKPTSAASLDDVPCISQGSQRFCIFPKVIVDQCLALPSNSVFAQCNIFNLAIGQLTTKLDETGNSYLSVLLKYSEQNNCLTGTNSSFTLLGKCDNFAAYVQIFRHLSIGKCYALVNSALLGMQRAEEVIRNNPNRLVQKLEIPGIYRRITFTPAISNPLHGKVSSVLMQTSNFQDSYLRNGPTISALSLLELESNLTVKRENLNPNATKVRLTRGISTNSDFLDILLSRREQKALFDVLSGCQ